jgi:hypothetical protein
MSNYKITYAERGPDIQLPGMEIVTDERYDNRIELYMLSENGERIEGGTFKLDDFMIVVRKFYNDNY